MTPERAVNVRRHRVKVSVPYPWLEWLGKDSLELEWF